jgi:hypothetical protein
MNADRARFVTENRDDGTKLFVGSSDTGAPDERPER